MDLQRAYSLLDIKAVDEDRRIIEGIASTPSPDRVGDMLDPRGAEFKLPLPLLWQHRQDQPIGEVFEAKVTSEGIWIKAQIAKAGVADYIDKAWALIREKLVRGLSVGWRATEQPKVSDGFFLFPKWLWLELSAVTIPANQDATIIAIKSLDEQHIAALGVAASPSSAGVPASRENTRLRKVSIRPVAQKTISEQVKDYEASRETKRARMNELAAKSADEGVTLDKAEEDEYDTLDQEIETINKHVQRLLRLEEHNKAVAVAPNGKNAEDASKSRDVQGQHHRIMVTEPKHEPGIEFTRMVLCKAASFLMLHKEGIAKSALDIAQERYPSNGRLHLALKAAVPAATTTNPGWAGVLVDPVNLANEFVEFLRPMTILGKFGRDGVPPLRNAPFNIRFIGETNDGDAYWVGQGRPKPLTALGYDATTLGFAKLATITVITQETARFSSPSAEQLARSALARAITRRMDIDFIDPAKAAVPSVSPASITNGLTPMSSTGVSADNVRADLTALLAQYIVNNQNVGSLVLIMPNMLALTLALMRNDLGNKEFPDMTINGGVLEGIPVIASQYAANASGAGNLVIAVNADEVFLADDGQVTVDASMEASLEMSDTPTQNGAAGTGASLVSLWQNNLIGLRAERFVNWQKRRPEAVVYMDDVNWGSAGSPS